MLIYVWLCYGYGYALVCVQAPYVAGATGEPVNVSAGETWGKKVHHTNK